MMIKSLPLPAILAAAVAPLQMAQAGVVVDATRVIYPAARKEVSLSLHNTGDAPALVQAWIDAGDPSAKAGEVKTPFALTPPLFRLDPAKGQTLRLIYTQEPLSTDRESVFWLNVLDIPPRAPARAQGENRLEMAFRHRLKILFRPRNLAGNPTDAAKAVTWTIVRQGGRTMLAAHNPTPYFISYAEAEVTSAGVSATATPDMLPPFADLRLALSRDFPTLGKVSIKYGFVNDFGGVVNGTASADPAPN
jgi:P pilus assembly chaperone PapD